MGYYSTVEGDIRFSREVTVDVLEEIQKLDSFYFVEPEEDSKGIFFDYAEGKFYSLKKDSEELVEILSEVGVTATGTLLIEGEENYDVWRLVFTPGSVVEEKVEMRWPDGSVYRG